MDGILTIMIRSYEVPQEIILPLLRDNELRPTTCTNDINDSSENFLSYDSHGQIPGLYAFLTIDHGSQSVSPKKQPIFKIPNSFRYRVEFQSIAEIFDRESTGVIEITVRVCTSSDDVGSRWRMTIFQMRAFRKSPEKRINMEIESLIPVNEKGPIIFSRKPLVVNAEILDSGLKAGGEEAFGEEACQGEGEEGGEEVDNKEVEEANGEDDDEVAIHFQGDINRINDELKQKDSNELAEKLNLVFVYSYDPIQPSIVNSLACGIFMCVEPLTCREERVQKTNEGVVC